MFFYAFTYFSYWNFNSSWNCVFNNFKFLPFFSLFWRYTAFFYLHVFILLESRYVGDAFLSTIYIILIIRLYRTVWSFRVNKGLLEELILRYGRQVNRVCIASLSDNTRLSFELIKRTMIAYWCNNGGFLRQWNLCS